MTALILVNFTLQATLFPHFSILGVTPDTALVFIVCYAILRGDIEGAIFGLCAGFVQDMMAGTFLGFFALLGFLTGYVCGKPFRDFFKDNYFLPFVIVVVISIVYQLIVFVTTQLIFGRLDFWFYARTIILPKTIYTASLSIPLYSFLHYINAKLEHREKNPPNRLLKDDKKR